MRVFAMGAALAACAAASGCVTAAVGAAAGLGVIVAQERTVGEALDDATGAAEIKGRLLAADSNGFAEVDVEMANGRLLLSGPVPSMEHRQAAEQIAWSVSRVDSVANEITVGPRSGAVRSTLDELITAQLRARLVASSRVRAIDINIETQSGVVYLMGLARTEEDVVAAAEIASLTPGVQRVVSLMQVRAPAERVAQAAPIETPLVAASQTLGPGQVAAPAFGPGPTAPAGFPYPTSLGETQNAPSGALQGAPLGPPTPLGQAVGAATVPGAETGR